MVGALDHYKAKGLDLWRILYQETPPAGARVRCTSAQDHGLESQIDKELIHLAAPALDKGEPVRMQVDPIRNVHRSVGTMLGSEVTRRYGAAGLPDKTIVLRLKGSAGQSLGAFLPRGITIRLQGDANDYVGKGLSGGRIIVRPQRGSTFAADQNVIIGNVALYGATGGELFVRGVAGERFAVRNSGAVAVVEGTGDHGCEYMTGGRVVVLGRTGRNFAAGMSGGIAFVLDDAGDFVERCNRSMVELGSLDEEEDRALVRRLVERHAELTKSRLATRLLAAWASVLPRFVRVLPIDYKRVLEREREEARIAAE